MLLKIGNVIDTKENVSLTWKGPSSITVEALRLYFENALTVLDTLPSLVVVVYVRFGYSGIGNPVGPSGDLSPSLMYCGTC